MDFQDFLNSIPQLTVAKLPAHKAHLLMAPSDRKFIIESQNIKNNPKTAAVLMLLYPKSDKTHLALIVRNSYEGVHSDQIAFPGGKFEEEDKNLEFTALRETHEEIGIDPKNIKIIRPFTHLYIPPSNFWVYPFLGFSKTELVFTPDPSEVAAIIEFPLLELLNDEIVQNQKITTSYLVDIEIPVFKINQHIVWGATAMMMSELKEVLKKSL